jgi:hypothetical protein
VKKIPYLNIILFILTIISTLAVGAMHEGINVLEEPLKIYRDSFFFCTADYSVGP